MRRARPRPLQDLVLREQMDPTRGLSPTNRTAETLARPPFREAQSRRAAGPRTHNIKLPASRPSHQLGNVQRICPRAAGRAASIRPPARGDSGSTSPTTSQIPQAASHRNAWSARLWSFWLTETAIDPRPRPSTGATRQPKLTVAPMVLGVHPHEQRSAGRRCPTGRSSASRSAAERCWWGANRLWLAILAIHSLRRAPGRNASRDRVPSTTYGARLGPWPAGTQTPTARR